MEKILSRAEELVGHVKEYADNRIHTVKLSVAEKVSKIIANIMAGVITMFIMFFFVVFASIALAIVIGEWTGKLYWGFLIIAALYLFAGIIVWVAKERILRLPIMNSLLAQFFSDSENEADDEKD